MSKEVYDTNSISTVGYVELTVSDLTSMVRFYEEVIGFATLEKSDTEARLSADGETELLVLQEDQNAIFRPQGTTGLFHLAILVPTRQDLAVTLKHLLDTGYPIQGASDHLYSEAIYLADPEGNGIEIYADLSPDTWKIDNGGNYITDTLPLNIESVFAELGNKEWSGLPDDTRMGHIHLQMTDLSKAKDFYVDILGFEAVTEGPGMLFVSKNRYHHHIGMNTWAGRGLPTPPGNARGLNHFTLNFTEQEIESAKTNLKEADYEFKEDNNQLMITDPSGNSLVLKNSRQ